jgi:hypothetical protein
LRILENISRLVCQYIFAQLREHWCTMSEHLRAR